MMLTNLGEPMIFGFGKLSFVAVICLFLFGANQDLSKFHEGPVISKFGKIATVISELPIPEGVKFKVRFDVGKQATPKKINSTFESAARFINMHVEAGVPRDHIVIALVVHGGASMDVTKESFYRAHNDNRSNASASAVEVLLKNNVEFYICGQSAAYHKIGNSDLLPGVKIALSAMTAHAILDQQGYSLNPF